MLFRSLYAPWEEVAADLPRLIPTGRLRWLLRSLPQLPAHDLRQDPELRRAMLLLSYLGHAYVWCDDTPAGAIPASLAVPWCDVAARRGRPPCGAAGRRLRLARGGGRRFDGVTLALGEVWGGWGARPRRTTATAATRRRCAVPARSPRWWRPCPSGAASRAPS